MSALWHPAGIRMRVVTVRESHLSYVVGGPAGVRSGDPALIFLHGNPTSSFLWRNVLAAMTAHHRCVAVDLIGMGRSGKPDIAYTYQDHLERLDDFLNAISTTSAVVVGHDWGGVLALHLARRRPDIVVGVAVCESHLRPWPAFEEMDPGTRGLSGDIPRLLLHGEPGAVVGASTVKWCADAANELLTIRPVGAGTHFLPEDCAEEIAHELESWLRAAFAN